MRLGRAVILCLITAAIISGCGRRGGLQLPPEAKSEKKAVQADKQAEPSRPFQKKKVPERPFVLDGLI